MRSGGVVFAGMLAALAFAQCRSADPLPSPEGPRAATAAPLTWSTASPPISSHLGQTATLLGDGRVLIAGGSGVADTAEVFDPRTASFTALPAKMHAKRTHHTATMLFSGQVLLTGGDGGKTAEVFDPVKNTFTSTGSMLTARTGHSAVRLTNGRVLVVGGAGQLDATTEIFDPSSGTFSAAPVRHAQGDGELVLLASAKVLFVGSFGSDLFDLGGPSWTAVPDGLSPSSGARRAVVRIANGLVLATATQLGINVTGPTTIQIFDPAANAGAGGWGAASADLVGATDGMSALLLPNGRTLLVGGGLRSNAMGVKVESDRAVIYDPSTDAITADTATPHLHHDQTATMLQNGDVLVVGGDKAFADVRPWPGGVLAAETTIPMMVPRYGAVAARLHDGTVLVAGGATHAPDVAMEHASAEIFDPLSKSFGATGSMQTARINAAAITLVSGKVLVAGGTSFNTNPIASAEVYDPATRLFHAASAMGRGRIDVALTRLADGQVLVTGGCAASPCPAELFDPALETFTTISTPLADHPDGGAVRLPNGQVLIVGGMTAELYDASKKTFQITAAPRSSRSGRTARLLGNGAVFAAGDTALDNQLFVLDATYPSGIWLERPDRPSTPSRMTWAVTPTGDALLTGGRTASGAEPFMLRFDELAPAAMPDVTYGAAGATGQHSPAVMLTTSARVLVAGGDTGGGGVLGTVRQTALLHGDGAFDGARPVLDSAPASVAGGATLTVGGQRFATRSPETPLAFWSPDTGEAVIPARVLSFTSSTLSIVAPSTAFHGPGFLHIVTAGIVSSSIPLEVTAAQTSAACTFDAQCATGSCTDGFCCDRRCDAPCEACSARRKLGGADGTCAAIVPGTDPDMRCFAAKGAPCTSTATCDKGLSCVTGVCCDAPCTGACLSCTVKEKVGTCSAVSDCDRTCDGDHTLKKTGEPDIDCAPFKCDGNMCRSTCASVNDCVGANVCTYAGICAAAPAVVSSPETFLGCAVSGTSKRVTGGEAWAAFGLVGLLGLVGVRRRRDGARTP
jgi:MYXO-CTERM domain-containing protein